MNHFFELQGKQIAYQIAGNGRPVVLLHGFAEDSRIWNEQKSYLQAFYQIITIDMPGSGASAQYPWSEGEGENIEFYANVLQHLLEQLQVTNCVVLGHSMGGYIALAFAKKHPNKLMGLGLVHSTAYADSTEKKANRQRGIEMMQQYGAEAFVKNTTPNLFGDAYKQQNADKITGLIHDVRYFEVSSLQRYYKAMMHRNDSTEVLKQLQVPIFMLIGTNDVAVPLQDSLQQCYLNNVTHVTILNNIGHMGMWEATAQVNTVMHQFLDSCFEQSITEQR